MKILAVVLSLALLGVTAVPASACRVGGETIVFPQYPTLITLENVEVISVHFTNAGETFERFDTRYPKLGDGNAAMESLRSLIGVAAEEDGAGQFPVYAWLTSCSHGFGSNPPHPWDTYGYLVGSWSHAPDGSRIFLAGGNWNGRWQY